MVTQVVKCTPNHTHVRLVLATSFRYFIWVFFYFTSKRNNGSYLWQTCSQSPWPEPIVIFLMCNISPLRTAELSHTSGPEPRPGEKAITLHVWIYLHWLIYSCLAATGAKMFAHYWLTSSLNHLCMLLLTLHGEILNSWYFEKKTQLWDTFFSLMINEVLLQSVSYMVLKLSIFIQFNIIHYLLVVIYFQQL